MNLDIAADGKVSGSMRNCTVAGSLTSSEPDPFFAGDAIWLGSVTFSGCGASFVGIYDMEIDASPPWSSSVVVLRSRSRPGSAPFLLIVGMMSRG